MLEKVDCGPAFEQLLADGDPVALEEMSAFPKKWQLNWLFRRPWLNRRKRVRARGNAGDPAEGLRGRKCQASTWLRPGDGAVDGNPLPRA